MVIILILFTGIIANISLNQGRVNALKQNIQFVEPLLDDGSGPSVMQFLEDNQNEPESVLQIPYYKERIRTWKNTRTEALGSVKFNMNHIKGNAHGCIKISLETGTAVPSFCMSGGRDAAIYIYQMLKIGQTMYLCHSWRNECWQAVNSEWEVASIIITYACSPNTATMFFQDQEGVPCALPCGVARILYQKEDDKIIATFLDGQGNPTELNNAGYRISKMESTSEGHAFYLDHQLLDMEWSKMRNWREMMIYFLLSYGGAIDWPD